MSWVDEVPPERATGELEGIYEQVRGRRGRVANIWTAGSMNPRALGAHLELYMSLLYRRGGLTRAQREMIGVLVSSLNGCSYCVTHHSEALSKYQDSEAAREISRANLESVLVGDADRAMLEYCVKLTRIPGKVEREDIDRLRAAGYDDPEIVDINLICSYFNFVNRLASGLGVGMEPLEERVYEY